LYRVLGRTCLSVSEISLGTVQFGMPYGIPGPDGRLPELSEKESLAIIRHALELGVNFLDTARNYGISEAVIGRALKRRPEEVYLATKLEPLPEDLSDNDMKKTILVSIEASRKALDREVIDLIQVHNATESLLGREIITETLITAQSKEWIRFKGVSTYGPEAPLRAINQGVWDTVQVEFNVLNQACLPVFDAAASENVGVIVRSAMLKGALTTDEKSIPESLKPIRQKALSLPRFFDCPDLSIAEICLLFVLSYPQVSTVLTGVATVEQLKENSQVSSFPKFQSEQLLDAQTLQLNSEKVDPRQWEL